MRWLLRVAGGGETGRTAASWNAAANSGSGGWCNYLGVHAAGSASSARATILRMVFMLTSLKASLRSIGNP